MGWVERLSCITDGSCDITSFLQKWYLWQPPPVIKLEFVRTETSWVSQIRSTIGCAAFGRKADNNSNKRISTAPPRDLSLTVQSCVRLKAVCMKHYLI